MDPTFFNGNPMRPPQWRAELAMSMVVNRSSPPIPGQLDDSYVRAYRRLLLRLLAAGDDEVAIDEAIHDQLHVFEAHELYHSPDLKYRQLLEARLLTQDELADIAHGFAMDPRTVESYEKLFFSVRDKMQARDSIAKNIIGPMEDLTREPHTQDQQGYILRLFAYHGGPHALNAVLNQTIPGEKPKRVKDIPKWFDETLGHQVRIRAAAAASGFAINNHNAMQFMRLASIESRPAPAKSGRSALKNPPDIDAIAAEVLRSQEAYEEFCQAKEALSRPNRAS